MQFKKPKFWDLKKPHILTYLTFFFTFPIRINNFFLNLKRSKKDQKIKTICLGNIYLGGTGKTPATIKLFEILKSIGFNVSTAKKFYKSHLDEINILKKKTDLILDNNREKIIELAKKQGKDVIIFDDGLQDLKVNYDIQFVCFDSENWIGNGFLLPAGPLREKLNSLKKYDAVLLKDSNENTNEKNSIIKHHNPSIKIFKTNYKIINLESFDLKKDYVIFSGIGNPKNFRKILEKNKFNIVKEIIFPDHVNYTSKNIEYLRKCSLKLNAELITTEKDYVKIEKIFPTNLKFLEISLNIDNEKELVEYLKSKIYE